MIRLLSLFSGIGAFEKALENMGANFEIVNYCEIDKYASRAYSLIHNVPEEKNLGDITKVDMNSLRGLGIDLISYGFPCQDISIAGRKKGFVDENGNVTRSGLVSYAMGAIQVCRPRVAIAENVKNLMSKKFLPLYDVIWKTLDIMGYNTETAVLNAADYGIPQHRERVFIISIRKDIYHGFDFPKPIPLKKSMKDYLEESVPEKYNLSEKDLAYMERSWGGKERWTTGQHSDTKDGISHCITSHFYKGVPDNVLVER